jgi:hypothetical protein
MAAGARRRDPVSMTRFRRAFVWLVIGTLVFTLVATLLIDGVA